MSGVALAILIVLNIRNGLGLAGADGTTQVGVIGGILIASVLIQNVLVRIQPASNRDRPAPCTDAGCCEPRDAQELQATPTTARGKNRHETSIDEDRGIAGGSDTGRRCLR